jgi:glutathione synthase/RimK-type ligase-like ATP-grasp enzyme
MEQDTPTAFIGRFIEVAADSDYSQHDRLRRCTGYDVQAAAEALWAHYLRKGFYLDEMTRALDEHTVVRAMLAATKHYTDDGHLVSAEFQEYWDQTDALDLSHGLLQQMQDELAGKFLRRAEAEGCTVVNNAHGIWLFKFGG